MADQITKLQPGNHQPMGVDWAGTDVEKEDDERDNVPDGTDYKPVKKSLRLYKSLIQDESLLKAIDDEDEKEAKKHEEGAIKDDEDHIASLEEDKDEDEKLLASMKKSFFEYVQNDPVLMAGIDSSPFLYEMVKSIGYSFLNLEDRLGSQIFLMDHHHTQFAKSVDGSFNSISKSLGFINGTAGDIDAASHSATGQNVQYLEKGGFGGGGEPLTKPQVLGALMKGVEAGVVSPLDVVKFETTGAVSPQIQKSLGL
jgi:hypothetical protein